MGILLTKVVHRPVGLVPRIGLAPPALVGITPQCDGGSIVPTALVVDLQGAMRGHFGGFLYKQIAQEEIFCIEKCATANIL
jgi:hypothetical protein